MAFLLRDRIFDDATVNTAVPFSHITFELARLALNAPTNTYSFCLHRPPAIQKKQQQKNKLTDAPFLSEFVDFLEHCNLLVASLSLGAISMCNSIGQLIRLLLKFSILSSCLACHRQ